MWSRRKCRACDKPAETRGGLCWHHHVWARQVLRDALQEAAEAFRKRNETETRQLELVPKDAA